MASRKITCLITGKSYTYGQDYYEKKTKDYIEEDKLPDADSQEVAELIEFHKIQASHTAKKISNTLNFATHKSDPEVAYFINNIRDYEQH